MRRSEQITVEKAKEIFRSAGGVMRTRQALGRGINPETLYAMRDKGMLETLSRGVYRLSEMPLKGSDDLISVAHRVAKARICLISALAYHGLTTQIPHFVYCAIPRSACIPKIDYPPVKFFRFSAPSYEKGVEYHDMSGARVAIYDAEKTLVDCFILKGALMLLAWRVEHMRPTRDIDLLGFAENSEENLARMLAEICSIVPQQDDGMVFDGAAVTTERIKEDADYEGVRIAFPAYLGSTRLRMRIDVGFDDAVVPSPEKVDYPVLLDDPQPKLKGYTPASVVAEKFEAMVDDPRKSS